MLKERYNMKDILKQLQSVDWYNTDAYDEAIEALIDYDTEHGGIDIVDYDTAEEIAKRELENGGLMRLKCFLAGAELGSDYYYLDGYGNLQNINRDWLIMQLEEAIENEEMGHNMKNGLDLYKRIGRRETSSQKWNDLSDEERQCYTKLAEGCEAIVKHGADVREVAKYLMQYTDIIVSEGK